jgi:uncharacterized membrane protein YbhN (UPF0104 family)
MRARHTLSIVLLVLITAGIAFYLYSQRQLLVSLKNVSLAAAACLVALRLVFLATNGLFVREYALRFGIRLAPEEWFGLAVTTTMGNYLTPFSGGMIARAAYLKHRHMFAYAQFATLLTFSHLVIFWVIGVAGMLTLLWLRQAIQVYWQLTAFFAAVVVAISALFISPPVRLPWDNRLARILNTSLEGWAVVKNDWRLLTRFAIYSSITVLSNGMGFWIAYRALGTPISYAAAQLISLLAGFSLLVRITPGNLGIQEAVVGLSSGLLGTGAGEGLLAALLIRAATVLLAFTLGPIFSLVLTREVTKHPLASQTPGPDAKHLHE